MGTEKLNVQSIHLHLHINIHFSLTVCFFSLIKRQELTGVVHINHKNSIMSTPLLIISCNFSSCPPLPVPSSD